MNKGDSSNLNKLNTIDLVNHLSTDKNNEKKDVPIDIRKLIQQKTIQAQQLKKANSSALTSINFNENKNNPQKNHTTPKPNHIAIKNIDDDDEDEDDFDDIDDYDEGDDGDGEYDIDDSDEEITEPNGNQSKQNVPKNIVLQEDDNETNKKQNDKIKPQLRPKNVDLPSNIDFGLDLVANKEVLGAISDDEDDNDDEQPAKNLFQKSNNKKPSQPKKFPSPKIHSPKTQSPKAQSPKNNSKKMPNNSEIDEDEYDEDDYNDQYGGINDGEIDETQPMLGLNGKQAYSTSQKTKIIQ